MEICTMFENWEEKVRNTCRITEDDLVLLCGKGHETTMQLADGAVPFDERAVVRQLLQDS